MEYLFERIPTSTGKYEYHLKNETENLKEIVYFTDGRMTPKNDTKTYEIIKKIFTIFVIVLVAGSLIFQEFLFVGESIPIWVCIFVVLGYLIKNGGHERVECPAQIQFYDEYLVFYVPKAHIKREKNRMEVQKIFYTDITLCKFRSNIQKFVIYGMMDVTYYEYAKSGEVMIPAKFHKYCDGIIKFYTVFDDYAKIIESIERNTPIKVEIENS